MYELQIVKFPPPVGAEPPAIAGVTWDRVSFRERSIDFRLPGVDHKNKRRAVVPISGDTVAMVERVYGHLSQERLLASINRL